MQRFFYSDTVDNFLHADDNAILGTLAGNNPFALEVTQRDAWLDQIIVLKRALAVVEFPGRIYFEYSIPRLGRRADVILLLGPVVFVIEFKVGERAYPSRALDQVWDYGLDLKNFHETSHDCLIAPILVATKAPDRILSVLYSVQNDRVIQPIACNSDALSMALTLVLKTCDQPATDPLHWESGRYAPTPTIIEAAIALYNRHAVDEISRNDAGAINLASTSACIEETIRWARDSRKKAVCFVTGVPGAGKTLVGLKVATHSTQSEQPCVFLSGNGPLVNVLQEALARDRIQREHLLGKKVPKSEALREVKMFIQNVHHFRDECLIDERRAPFEHVAIFDEAQRAWNHAQTNSFMTRKKGRADFNQSEPEFLISCLERHPDWAVIVCLVGGGQEINTGEVGIGEWIDSVVRRFPDWHLFISSQLVDSEYAAGEAIQVARRHQRCVFRDELHLAVSMRSYRAENVSQFIKNLLDLDLSAAQQAYGRLKSRYPLVMTRDINKAKVWVRSHARGTERFGLLASSRAQRLKPHAIDVRVVVDPVHWFLAPKEDVRSSYYLEDVATEFQVQGLELDWACVTWDADFRHTQSGWGHFSFARDRWNRIRKPERQEYLKNAYRVLLTRARQGMVIVVPDGEPTDPTRAADFYDHTFDYLKTLGIQSI